MDQVLVELAVLVDVAGMWVVPEDLKEEDHSWDQVLEELVVLADVVDK